MFKNISNQRKTENFIFDIGCEDKTATKKKFKKHLLQKLKEKNIKICTQGYKLFPHFWKYSFLIFNLFKNLI
jgi:hypothetical protein